MRGHGVHRTSIAGAVRPAADASRRRSGGVSRRRERRSRRRPRRCGGCAPGARSARSASDGGLDARRPRRRSRGGRAAGAPDRIAAVGSAFCWPAMSGAEPCTGSNIDGRGPVGVDVAADAASPMPPVIGGGEVGDDVAEEVVGDDHVEARRVGGQEDRRGVDVQVVDGDVGELRAPPRSTSRDHTAPAWTSTLVLWTRVSFLRGRRCGAGEGVADDALDAERGVDADLGGDLVRGADAQRAAVAGVGALGALADDDEVDLARGRPAARSTPGKIRDGRRLT